MSRIATAAIEQIAKVYNLSTNVRATDILRNVNADLPPQAKLVQSILEHSAMVAMITTFVYANYSDLFREAGFIIRPEHSSFMGLHHDDPEWWTLDMVPTLGFRSLSPEEKRRAEQEAMEILLGPKNRNSLLWQTHDEYEARVTDDAVFVKTCDILELFCHNRILASYDVGIITWDNYKTHAPEVLQESEQFLKDHDAAGAKIPLSIADILERIYIEKFKAFGFPPVMADVFFDLTETIRTYPFCDIVRVDR